MARRTRPSAIFFQRYPSNAKAIIASPAAPIPQTSDLMPTIPDMN